MPAPASVQGLGGAAPSEGSRKEHAPVGFALIQGLEIWAMLRIRQARAGNASSEKAQEIICFANSNIMKPLVFASFSLF